ncbi:cyclic pyranopterin monophosphate synthase MoaC [Fictibacillus nanhaiensis]|jgi:cyclic pyranopterin monophosphate synthase|uniref:cyclic pyranopterin monophosphate synthase MoaC n=1 Tax=Fictibacillus nanhaiensis TaxID=742169 RepID=UPI00203CEB2B|nr:cyclic pyranopterin monophosphate synthase MoaC [Fictibacillus nanhaiensis]MCM3733811.1 cyclic pyranopterin monophosphate synthase MoaC [Fictibacillus nanhaiensis]
MKELTHFNEEGRARMVDISEKETSYRTAIAVSGITVSEEVFLKIKDNKFKKGDVLAVAQIAGIMAAKKTSDWIPMCHPLSLTGVDLSFQWNKENEEGYKLNIQAEVRTKGSTGVEMEALTAASAAALTVYDMCKAADKGMIIGPTYLVSKTGGKNGDFVRSSSPDKV